MLGWDFTRVQDDVNLQVLRMLEGTCLLDVVQVDDKGRKNYVMQITPTT